MRILKIIPILLIFPVFFYSCELGEESDDEPLEIFLVDSQLKPFQLALIEVNSNLGSQSFYEGDIDDESVRFKSNDNFLIFQVPAGSVGTKIGKIRIDNKEFEFEYQLISNSFADPEVYLQNYFQEQEAQQVELEELQNVFIQDSIPVLKKYSQIF